MTAPIPINLAVEDELTESLTRRILPAGYFTSTVYNRGGNGYLKQRINGFNRAARGIPFLVGTDLDRYDCPPNLIADWLTQPKHHNLLIRVAVREAEAWVLADRQGFATFLGIGVGTIPENIEGLPNPKEKLIALVRTSRKKQLRDDICPPRGSTSKIGPNYNARLSNFVAKVWNPATARLNSESLDRTINRLVLFTPQWAAPT